MRGDELFDGRVAAHGTDLLGNLLPSDEDQEGGETSHPFQLGEVGVLARIELHNLQGALMLTSDAVNLWAERATRDAPVGPKVHEHGQR